MRKTSLLPVALFVSALAWAPSVLAADLSAEDREALSKTQALLRDPSFLKSSGNSDEKAALEAVESLTRNQPQAEGKIHALSASVFENVVKEANGDPAKISELLLKAKADPKRFFESLSPSQQNEIRSLASEIDKANEAKKASK